MIMILLDTAGNLQKTFWMWFLRDMWAEAVFIRELGRIVGAQFIGSEAQADLHNSSITHGRLCGFWERITRHAF